MIQLILLIEKLAWLVVTTATVVGIVAYYAHHNRH